MNWKLPHGNDISIAQWALVEEMRAGAWTTLDFPGIARNEFGINGIELVNTLLEVPTERYLHRLKQNASQYDIRILLIMCDDEGDGASSRAIERRQFVINHRKWIDIAAYLGCHSIRTNCRAGPGDDKTAAMDWAIESYRHLLEYASTAGIQVLVENHGGLSDDADWVVALVRSLDHPFFGTYPDWREPQPGFDNFKYLQKTLPYARGMSYRNQPTDELTIQMINYCREAGYPGWYGIESSGRAAIQKGIRMLKTNLSQ